MVTPNPTPADPNPRENIFSMSLAPKVLVQKRLDEEERENKKRSMIYLITAAVLLLAYSIFFFYPQAKQYLGAPSQLAQINSDIKTYEDVTLPSLSKEKDVHKAAYDEKYQSVESKIDKVFPADTDKLDLVQTLENFATALNAKNPPFELNAISISDPIQKDGYTVFPLSTSIYSSRENFNRFLQLIDLSGRMDSDINVRLLEISNISIRYRGIDPTTGEDRGVDFSVKLNAYSR